MDEYLEQRLRLMYYWRFTVGKPDLHAFTNGYKDGAKPTYVEAEAHKRGEAFCRGRTVMNDHDTPKEFRLCNLEPDENEEIELLLDIPNPDYRYDN